MLPEALKPFLLPNPPDGEELRQATRASCRLIGCAPNRVTVPLLAAVYRAPLGSCAFTVHIAGPSGAGKSVLASLAQQHFGAEFTINGFPGSWLSTANALAHTAFIYKDGLFVIDDFAPTGGQGDIDRFHRDADRLIRGQANGAGRARMRADGNLRPTTPPRGLILSTKEDVPRGQSLRARMLIVQVAPPDVNWEQVTASQSDGNAGEYSKAMAGYLRRLAPKYGELKRGLRSRVDRIRERAAVSQYHRRTPDIVANLMLGLEQFLTFAVFVGAMSAEEAEALTIQGWDSLVALGDEQILLQNVEEPTKRFLELLSVSIRCGGAHMICARTGDRPADSFAWGWSPEGSKGRFIGWVEGEEVFLIPGAAYAAIQRLAREQNTCFPLAEKTLWRRLAEKGLLLSHDRDHNTILKTFPSGRWRVLHLSATALIGTSGTIGGIGESLGQGAKAETEVVPLEEVDL